MPSVPLAIQDTNINQVTFKMSKTSAHNILHDHRSRGIWHKNRNAHEVSLLFSNTLKILILGWQYKVIGIRVVKCWSQESSESFGLNMGEVLLNVTSLNIVCQVEHFSSFYLWRNFENSSNIKQKHFRSWRQRGLHIVEIYIIRYNISYVNQEIYT